MIIKFAVKQCWRSLYSRLWEGYRYWLTDLQWFSASMALVTYWKTEFMNNFLQLWNTSLLKAWNFWNALIKRRSGCKQGICSLKRENMPARVWQVHCLNLSLRCNCLKNRTENLPLNRNQLLKNIPQRNYFHKYVIATTKRIFLSGSVPWLRPKSMAV